MKLNCQAGDLAIVKAPASPKNRGKVVLCVRLATAEELDEHWFTNDDGPVWFVTPNLVSSRWGDEIPLCRDKSLRPLKWDDGEDEMLRIAGKPVTHDLPLDAFGEPA